MNANLFELFRTHWSVAPDRQFLVPNIGDPVTYRHMDARSASFAGALRESGVTPGERVVAQIDKSVDNVALYLACLRVGAVYVPLNTAYTEREVAYFLDDAQPKVAITNHNFADWRRRADDAEPWTKCAPRLADDLAAIVYTSGTTGKSKGAMLSHGNLTSNALTLHAIWRFTPGDVLLHILPIYHVHGLFVALHTAMLNASTVLFCDRFDIDQVVAWLPDSTVMMGVPTHYGRLMNDERFTADLCTNVRLFTSGSAPMTGAQNDAFAEVTGHRILERYGMSETGMLTSNPYDGDRVAGTVGFALPAVALRVVDEHGNPCAPGEAGVVQVHGPNVFAGYWRKPERTDESFDGEWFITGDVGVLDAEGRLTLEGRSSDMIISGGLNVYPKEIEMVLDAFPGVEESAVVGQPDDDLGERVVAFVTGSEIDVDTLEAHARSELAGFKVPKLITVIDSLPRNSMGKIQKVALRSRVAD